MTFKNTKQLKTHIEYLLSKIQEFIELYSPYEINYIYYTDNPKTVKWVDGIYCYSDEKGYHRYELERGKETSFGVTSSLFEISYKILKSIVSNLASSYEVRNRVKGQDCRRIMFSKTLEIWGVIGEEYRQCAEKEIDSTLKKYPYDDEAEKKLEEILEKQNKTNNTD